MFIVGVLYEVKQALCRDHVAFRPSVCDPVSGPNRWSDCHKIQEFLTKIVGQAWVLWKSVQWQLYFI